MGAVINKVLLAKSSKHPIVTLVRHSIDVFTCAQFLFGERGRPTSLGKSWSRLFNLDNFDSFILNLYITCLFHDIGKANNGFQGAVQRKTPQILRHEHMSALLLLQPSIQEWLKQFESIFYEGILSAVAGHHLKAADSALSTEPLTYHFCCSSNETEWMIETYFQHEEVLSVLKKIADILDSTPPSLEMIPTRWDKAFISQGRSQFERINRLFKRKDEKHNLLLALKAAVIACDSLGSAMPRMDINPETWVQNFATECFNDELLTPEWLQENVIDPRIRDIEENKGSFEPHDFQLQAAKLGSRSLLLSGCGTGKTLAAWFWIREQLKSHPARRVIFLYPTRTTATEGFRDYASWAGEDASLVHGTAVYDLEGMFDNPLDPIEDSRRSHLYEQDARLFALGYWPKKVFTATVDSFLSFMANQYSAICLLPVLAESIIVVDEVHAFDSKMFTALERFLEFFSIPVLCMTASLPPRRLKILQDNCNLDVFPHDIADFEDLEKQMGTDRYQVSTIDAASIAQKAIESIQANKKVMCVVNTVNQCQKLAQEMVKHLDEKIVLCYHSRFRLCDRKKIHKEVIGKFRQSSGPLLLITTQVCEMSLDLDADVLITELAPVPSLIQRMGRCCRHLIPSSGRIGEVLFAEPKDHKPYKSEEISQAKAFIEELIGYNRLLSQTDLVSYLDKLDKGPDRQASGLPTLFTHSYLFSPPGKEDPFREGSDFTIDCILDFEIEEYHRLRREKDPQFHGYVVPVPKYLAKPDPTGRLGGSLKLAPYAHYSEKYGFCNEEVEAHVRPHTCLIV